MAMDEICTITSFSASDGSRPYRVLQKALKKRRFLLPLFLYAALRLALCHPDCLVMQRNGLLFRTLRFPIFARDPLGHQLTYLRATYALLVTGVTSRSQCGQQSCLGESQDQLDQLAPLQGQWYQFR